MVERVFTEDSGRYKKGDVRDYPPGTWKNFFKNFEKITKPVGSVIQSAMASKKRGRPAAA